MHKKQVRCECATRGDNHHVFVEVGTWYSETVTPRHLVLTGAALAVLGMCVYLFLEVRKPASAQVSGNLPPAPREVEPEAQPPAKPPPPRDAAVQSAVKPLPPPPDTPSVKPTPDPANDPKAAFKLDQLMAEANKAYDHQDFDEARAIAQKVLAQRPGNGRMLRILVSAACVEMDGAEAQKQYALLTAQSDKDVMKARCTKYGIALADPPK
jgi:hypothetical protein